jgi:hypothetical protein
MLNAVCQTDLYGSFGSHAHTNLNPDRDAYKDADPHSDRNRDGDLLSEWIADSHPDFDANRDADSNCDADRYAHARIMGRQLRRQCN